MPSEVPTAWSVQPLGGIAAIVMGQSPPSSAVAEGGDGLPFIQGNAEFGARHPTPKLVAMTTPKVAQAGDILLSVRAPVGEVNIAEGPLCIGRGVSGIRATACDPDFLFYAVGGLSRTFGRLSQGSTFDAINGTELRSIDILLPPLDEQRRIAEVLRSVDIVVAAATEAFSQSEKTVELLIKSAFDGGGERVRLGMICALIYRYPGFYGFEQKAEGVPVIRGEHLRNGKISSDWTNYYFVDPGFSDRFPKTILQRDDVVMSVRGTVGTTAIVDDIHIGSQISPNLIRLVANSERLLPPLLYYAVQSAVAHMRATIVNAQALPAINAGDIKAVEIALPPHRQQHEILLRLQAATEACADARNVLEKHISARAAVADDLLSGRVRVPA